MALFKRLADRRRIRKLARSWQEFRATLEPWFGNEEPVPESRERAFLVIKSSVAQQLPVLGQVYGRRPLEQESIAAQRDITELMNRMNSLSSATKLGAPERDEMFSEWHVLYIFLNKLEGTLTGSTADGVVLAEATRTESEHTYLHGPVPRQRGSLLGFVVRATVVAVLLIIIAMVLGFDADHIRAWLPGPDQVDGAAVAQAPTGETEVPAPSAPLLSHVFRMPRLVQPVVSRYGTAGVAILCGALLTGTLMLFRLRSR